ncbi:hypothetical protein BDY21DRAFT_334335 [Lineolata rhizophorae]|uniref:G-patch domain-containing protein n=1 Tax=Lineolata rhizophorae TaxID=578093 RepID=A0A6A6PCF7_9PEZI|nr:hypothetical protein BDY21DRAFT_334335 [Lineolata rhizophorae]
MPASSDDETYTIPLKDQRAFGAGIKRKRIAFVPASDPTSAAGAPRDIDGASVADRYLEIVLGKSAAKEVSALPAAPGEATAAESERRTNVQADGGAGAELRRPSSAPVAAAAECDICKLPITSVAAGTIPHEATLAHQVCLEHSYPPSAIDRNRKGLAVLRAQGWDPDARAGLGVGGEGILHPIKVVEKNDTVGLGVDMKKEKDGAAAVAAAKKKPKKLDAGQVRAKEKEDRVRMEKLRRAFYQSDDVTKYLEEMG